MGYNNICVGIDMPPALWTTATLYGLCSAATLNYVLFALHRLKVSSEEHMISLSKPEVVAFYFCNLFYLFGGLVFALCFVNHPWDNLPAHTRPFEIFMVGKLLAVWAVFYEEKLSRKFSEGRYGIDKKKKKDPNFEAFRYLWYVIFTITSLGLPVLFELNMAHRQRWLEKSKRGEHDGEDFSPYVLREFTCVVDWTWFGCFVLTGTFLPKRPIMVGRKLVHRETISLVKSLFDKDAEKMLKSRALIIEALRRYIMRIKNKRETEKTNDVYPQMIGNV